jgi:hypothetical protein
MSYFVVGLACYARLTHPLPGTTLCVSSPDMRADVQKIFVQTPVEKQVMMFSATLSPEVRTVCRKFMSDVRMGVCLSHESVAGFSFVAW